VQFALLLRRFGDRPAARLRRAAAVDSSSQHDSASLNLLRHQRPSTSPFRLYGTSIEVAKFGALRNMLRRWFPRLPTLSPGGETAGRARVPQQFKETPVARLHLHPVGVPPVVPAPVQRQGPTAARLFFRDQSNSPYTPRTLVPGLSKAGLFGLALGLALACLWLGATASAPSAGVRAEPPEFGCGPVPPNHQQTAQPTAGKPLRDLVISRLRKSANR